jgi:hypothetical protein
MSAGHASTDPRLPSPWDFLPDGSIAESVKYVAMEAEDLSHLPGNILAAHEAKMVQAREYLNDALAKIATERERNTPLPLLERMH